MALIVTVLKQSKKFTTQHAQWIHKQFGAHESVCLTDATHIDGVKTAPLLHDFPGWWSKIELFNPDHPVLGKQDLLYFDIDIVITGDITPLLQAQEFTMLSGLAYKNQCNSSLMYIPCSIKQYVWDSFMANPQQHMDECVVPEKWGDQGFLSGITTPKEWQQELPNRIYSYKLDIATPTMLGYDAALASGKGTGVPPKDAILVCFHGYPSPWKTGLSWVPFFSIKEKVSGKMKAVRCWLKAKKRQRQA
ncbi:hypothetical protein LVJ82_14610 [Vitreoscilla massiliensis]|uniref:Glycosyltransferase n=1 Tax=Vitreoscilla massiliensis TaxID=1689272 RepID=A0ABY4DYU3_9NEIS|nr:hypothetical protein [Vitreoscilla massiliensis]UOO88681.1 hypothetical protein LVJ82_14610 [Vitreoscilla massiliensis]